LELFPGNRLNITWLHHVFIGYRVKISRIRASSWSTVSYRGRLHRLCECSRPYQWRKRQ